MYKVCFYVPESHLESVKQALFAAGAGRQGDYDQCCWQTLGEGQFRPLAGSKPYLGKTHCLSRVREYKVEMLCEEKIIANVLATLRKCHPYEEPAFDVIRLETP